MNTISIQENYASLSGPEQLNSQLEQAVKCFINRQSRSEHPDGHFDNGNRWYPDEDEKRICCSLIRHPSREYPFSLMAHCRTMIHIAKLFDVYEWELKDAVHAYKKSNKLTAEK